MVKLPIPLPALSRAPARSLAFITFFLLVLLYICLEDLYIQPATSSVTLHDTSLSPIDTAASNANSPSSTPSPPPQNAPTVTNPPRILLVSALFPLSKSKHSASDYASWLSRFLSQITTDVYFYTTPELAPTVLEARKPGTRIVVNTTYASAFSVPPLHGLEKTYEAMHTKDREKKRHSPELYAVWNAKPFLLAETVRMLSAAGEEYEYAFWNDAGSFRDEHVYEAWPDPMRVEVVWEEGARLTGKAKEELLFFPIYGMPSWKRRYWMEEDGPVDNEFSEGSFFGGSPETIAWWCRTFYAYHDYYLSLGHFIGKDQTLINALFMLFPERIFTVWQNDPSPTVVPLPFPTSSQNTSSPASTPSPPPAFSSILPAHFPLLDLPSPGACGPDWYYYQFFLSAPSTQLQMQELWLAKSRWADWAWWRARQRCRLVQPRGMGEVLRGWFGRGWGVVRGAVGMNA